jgi:enoyl-CoA hydratase/carnithine racemase
MEWGLVNRVVPAEQLDQETAKLAASLASKPPATLTAGKRAFYLQMDMDLTRAYELAGEVISSSFAHAEGRDGMAAFIEKRPPPGTK